jgi:hypothetical protein
MEVLKQVPEDDREGATSPKHDTDYESLIGPILADDELGPTSQAPAEAEPKPPGTPSKIPSAEASTGAGKVGSDSPPEKPVLPALSPMEALRRANSRDAPTPHSQSGSESFLRQDSVGSGPLERVNTHDIWSSQYFSPYENGIPSQSNQAIMSQAYMSYMSMLPYQMPMLPAYSSWPAVPQPAFESNVPSWHTSANRSGTIEKSGKLFTKTKYHGRLSLVTEDVVKVGGIHHYACTYVGGDVSPADGVGFLFGTSLPTTQNIQKVESVFVNKHGIVCSRTRWGVSREQIKLAPLVVGAHIGVSIDLDMKQALFRLEKDGEVSSVVCDFGQVVPQGPVSGYFGAVVKHSGVSIELEELSWPPPVKMIDGRFGINPLDEKEQLMKAGTIRAHGK